MTHVSGEQIIGGLQRLGLKAGMRVMVHSSLSSFGHVQGGALTVIAALQDVLTPAGVLMMPSFNHEAPFFAGGPGHYDPANTPTGNGKIPDTFWRMQGVYRSLAPTHPFAAWGNDAQRYVQHHHRTLAVGEDSPLGMLAADGGFGLLVGVDYRSNTYHHVVEYMMDAPCLGYRSDFFEVRLPDGRTVEGRSWTYRSRACPIDDPALYGREMHRRGLHRQETVGQSTLTFFKLQECGKMLRELLTDGYEGHPPCNRCPIRPGRNARTVTTDWDREKGQLLPDSAAFNY